MPNLLNGQFWPFHVKAASAKLLAWLLRNILNKNLYNLALLLCMALTVPLNTCVKSRAFHAATLQRCLAASFLCVINRWCCVSQVINKSVITITFFTKTENVNLFTFKLSYCIISYSLNLIYCILCDILRHYVENESILKQTEYCDIVMFETVKNLSILAAAECEVKE